MCTADAVRVSGDAFGSAADALRAMGAALDYLNSPAAASIDGTTCGELLLRLALREGRHVEGSGQGIGPPHAPTRRPPGAGHGAGDGVISESLAFTIADWTRKLPADMRTETDRILLPAAAAGASMDDLATIAACAIEKWRQQQPDPDHPDDAFEDRYVQVGMTFGGAGVIRGNLTPSAPRRFARLWRPSARKAIFRHHPVADPPRRTAKRQEMCLAQVRPPSRALRRPPPAP